MFDMPTYDELFLSNYKKSYKLPNGLYIQITFERVEDKLYFAFFIFDGKNLINTERERFAFKRFAMNFIEKYIYNLIDFWSTIDIPFGDLIKVMA